MIYDDTAYTTQAAANFLGVSRQHIVDLLKEDKIPYHNVGSHHRIMIKDLLAYAENRKREKTDALNDLFDEVNKAGKYDASYLEHDS
jgi:excisionase family DNA binding protein